MTTNETFSIPLNKLIAWDGNVRKTDSDKHIEELAASIEAHGLLQSLVVRKEKAGKYGVVAGRRRYLALQSLQKAGTIKATYQVPVHVIGADANPTEVSLVENVHRENMHPADEFEAFKSLIDGGLPASDVGIRCDDRPRGSGTGLEGHTDLPAQ